MKKLICLYAISFLIIASTCQAQQKSGKSKLIDGIKKEKLREPVKLEGKTKEVKKNDLIQKKLRSTDQKVSTTASGNEEGEAQICIDPSNSNNLVMSYMNNSASGGIEYPVYFSNNGGTSWTKSTFDAMSILSSDFPGGTFVGGGDPVFAYDKIGNLYFSWIYLVAVPTFDTMIAAMYWAKSTNNGASFTLQPGNNHFIGKAFINPFSPDFDVYPGSEGFYDRQWLAVDQSSGPNANTLYASFIYFNTPSESLSLTGGTIKKLNSAGTAFSSKIQALQGMVQFNNVRVDKTGVLHITGADVDNNKVLYAKSTNGGTTFSTPIQVAAGTNLFGTQGGGFIHDRENAAVNMEVDTAKNVHVVWSDFDVTPNANYNSFYSRLNNSASTFSAPINLKTLFYSNRNVLMPVVSTAGNRITIGAYVIDSSKVGDYYIVNSDDNGSNWTTPIKVSSASTNFSSVSNVTKWFGDYYNAVRTDTKVHNIWSDGRGSSGPKMYVSTSTLWPTSVTDVTPINSTLQLESAYPNPIQSNLNLNFIALENDDIVISIYNIEGKTIFSNTYSVKKGEQKVSINFSNKASGNYILKILNKDGFEIMRHLSKE